MALALDLAVCLTKLEIHVWKPKSPAHEESLHKPMQKFTTPPPPMEDRKQRFSFCSLMQRRGIVRMNHLSQMFQLGCQLKATELSAETRQNISVSRHVDFCAKNFQDKSRVPTAADQQNSMIFPGFQSFFQVIFGFFCKLCVPFF